VGSGTLILAAANSYTGGTTVSDGTLCLANPDALLDGTSLTVGDEQTWNSDATVDGDLAESPILIAPPTALPGVVAVPEPPALALLAAALVVWCLHRWRGYRSA
jgi:autotransporter-associated beta strand protein